jgi:hypothetical protein
MNNLKPQLTNEFMFKIDDTMFDYKGISIDLFKLAFDIANDNLADLIEIFRLEGSLTPIIMKQPLNIFHDISQNNLLNSWLGQLNNQIEKNLPYISILPLSSLKTLGQIKIAFKKDNNFHYVDTKKYIHENKVSYITSSKKNIINSGSPNALLYHTIKLACLLKSDIFYTIHYTKDTQIGYQGWYSMHVPFIDNQENDITKGVISLVRKI